MAKKKIKKKRAKTKERSEKDPRRLADGTFAKGNEIGKETRFKPNEPPANAFCEGNTVATKYDDKFITYLYEYFYGGYEDIGKCFPTVGGFIYWLKTKRKISISYATIDNWKSGNVEFARGFSEAFKECEEYRRDILMNGGLSRRFDASFSRFLASSMYDMREKTESKQEIDGGIGLNVNISYFEGEENK
jgi:hypothetical protein